ncbi:RDD family protein [Brevibacillus dissolubilis]|uniref:RDD family protein n=1 Tax=Brevibacillus dissolubilis TaxID=1844116 RepID=UPI0011175206|nr:RDD family protein [Brevibacillus dissolubilis]
MDNKERENASVTGASSADGTSSVNTTTTTNTTETTVTTTGTTNPAMIRNTSGPGNQNADNTNYTNGVTDANPNLDASARMDDDVMPERFLNSDAAALTGQQSQNTPYAADQGGNEGSSSSGDNVQTSGGDSSSGNNVQSFGGDSGSGNNVHTFSGGSAAVSRDYAGFWLRFAATVVDSIFLSAVNAIIFDSMERAMGIDNPAQTLTSMDMWAVLFNFAYIILLTWWTGQTLGKMLFRIRVVNANTHTSGERLSFGQVILREVIGKLLSSLVLLIGYLWMLFNDEKQTWHDKLAKTYVVRVPR